jgi:hypothetical protein
MPGQITALPFLTSTAGNMSRSESWIGCGKVYKLTIYSVQRCTDRFKAVITLYTEKTNDRAVKKFDILGCHTWEEVQETAAKAVEAYNAKEKGFKGFLRKVGRKFGKASPAHQGWIQTL